MSISYLCITKIHICEYFSPGICGFKKILKPDQGELSMLAYEIYEEGRGKDDTTEESSYQIFSKIPSNLYMYNSLEKTMHINKSV